MTTQEKVDLRKFDVPDKLIKDPGARDTLIETVSKLREALTDTGITHWLNGKNWHLEGKTPIDELNNGNIKDVKNACDALLEGGFT